MALWLAVAPTWAQGTVPPEASDEARAALYEQLARDVEQLEQQGNVIKRVVQLVKPSVVHIDARKPESGVGHRAVEEAGSGVLIEHRGRYHVLTNRHVIHEAPLAQIKIRLADGRALSPVRVESDIDTDVAVLTVDAQELVAARIGDSDQVEIGDFVLAVGSPFGLSHSVTYGIISAKGRRDLQLGNQGLKYQDFFQTDAAINPGNSGGPLLNLRGEVIGINTAIASSSGGSEGIGFTIPIKMAMFVARQLMEEGNVVRAFLGVQLDADYDAETAARLGLPRPVGARVKAITPQSAAEVARVQLGDVILEFDGVRVEDDEHLINLVSLTPIGKEVAIVLFRNGGPVSLRARVGRK